MQTLETIRKRRSIRKFTGEAVPREDLLRIVDAGRLAASGHNKQPWDFVMVTEEALIEAMSARCSAWMADAGAIIVLVVDPASRWWMEDGSAAAENILLAATDLGYGSCWVEGTMLPHEQYFKELLDIPQERRILTLIPIGVPERWPGDKEKKSLSEVVHWQRWGQRL
jgi:nitroreductase